MLNQASITYSDKPYLSDKGDNGWVRTSFSDTQTKVKYIASAFLELGLEIYDHVAILSEAKTNWIISAFGSLFSGGISVPLSIKLLPQEIVFRVNHSESKFLILSENTLEKVISRWDQYTNRSLRIIVLDKPSKRISEQCEHYGFDEKKLLFIDDLYLKGKNNFKKNQQQIEDIEKNVQEDDVVTISYTSGTTGNPKGIMLTNLNYYSNSIEAINTFKIKELISTLLILPTDHSFAHTIGIYTALTKGISIHFVDARGGGMNALKNIPKNLIEACPNFLLTVPALSSNFMQKMKEGIHAKGSFVEGIFNRGLEAAIIRNGNGFTKPGSFIQLINYFNFILAEKLIFKKLRLIFGEKIEFLVGGGALLDINQQQFYKAIGIPVYQGYGLSEASPIISTNTPYQHKMGTSGKLLGGIVCKICDDNGSEVSKGEKGEIVIKGDNVMKGYYKNEKATLETLKDGWLYTGDIGFFDKDDFLVVSGRAKALLISEDGEKYSPEEIEETIANCSTLINQVMIYNDHQKLTTALITLNLNYTKKWIQNNNMNSYSDLLIKIKEELLLFRKQDEFKNKFPKKWIPSNFQIIEEEFSEANEMVNSTLKMVRYKITKTYKNRLDIMYLPNANKIAIAENEKVLMNLFQLK